MEAIVGFESSGICFLLLQQVERLPARKTFRAQPPAPWCRESPPIVKWIFQAPPNGKT